jgi:hypothetical protein
VYAICRAADGGVVLAGSATSTSGQGLQAFVMKVSASGDSLWSIRYPSQTTQWDTVAAHAIYPTFDGGFIVTGNPGQFGGGYAFLLKITAAGDSLWAHSYSLWYSNVAHGVVQAADTALVSVGGSGASPQSMYMLRTSRTGGIRFNRLFGSGVSSYAMAVVATPDNGMAIAGRLDSLGGGAALVRMDYRFNPLWERIYEPGTSVKAAALQRTQNGGYILAGAWGTNSTDAYAVCTDSGGNALWSRHFGGTQNDEAAAVQQLANSSFILAGWTLSATHGGSDGMVSQLTPTGAVAWTATVGQAGDDAFTSLAPTDDGGFYVAGYTQSAAGGITLASLLRYPPSCGIEGTTRDSITNRPVPNVRVGVVGRTESALSDTNGRYALYVIPGTYDFVISGVCVARDTLRGIEVLTDSLLAVDWRPRLPQGGIRVTSLSPVVHNHITASVPLYVHNDGPGVLDYSVRSVTYLPATPWLSVSPAHGSVAAQDSFPAMVTIRADTSNNGVFDYLGYLFVTVNSCPDTLLTVAVSPSVLDADNHSASLPEKFDLTAFPNPFNPLTTLTLSVPQRTPLTLRLYDITGRVVRTLYDGVCEAGVQRLTVDGSTLPSGVYFVRLQTSTVTLTRKIMLLR